MRNLLRSPTVRFWAWGATYALMLCCMVGGMWLFWGKPWGLPLTLLVGLGLQFLIFPQLEKADEAANREAYKIVDGATSLAFQKMGEIMRDSGINVTKPRKPKTCAWCGFALNHSERECPKCGGPRE